MEQRTQHGLSRARRAHEHEPLGQLASQRCELVGVPEIVHHFLQLRLHQRIDVISQLWCRKSSPGYHPDLSSSQGDD